MGWYLTYRIAIMCDIWLHEQWNIPDRHDHYLMGLMCQVARIFSSSPGSIQPSKMKIVFDLYGKQKLNEEEEKKHIENVKAMRMASLGGRGRMTKVDRNGNVIEPAKMPPKGRRILSRGNSANTSGIGNTGNEANSGLQGTQDQIERRRGSIHPIRGYRRRI